ncbi:hypothetical protein [Pandoraea iniqua]|nr:hypothetical protein [Pandoraea iniqua]
MFRLHEAGQRYAEELKAISQLVGRTDVMAAFGSTGAEGFARELAIDWNTVPVDLSERELLELLDAVSEGSGNQERTNYWLRCLVVNTGDTRISDLIFWPDKYVGSSYDGREYTSNEILEIVLKNGRTK